MHIAYTFALLCFKTKCLDKLCCFALYLDNSLHDKIKSDLQWANLNGPTGILDILYQVFFPRDLNLLYTITLPRLFSNMYLKFHAPMYYKHPNQSCVPGSFQLKCHLL